MWLNPKIHFLRLYFDEMLKNKRKIKFIFSSIYYETQERNYINSQLIIVLLTPLYLVW